MTLDRTLRSPAELAAKGLLSEAQAQDLLPVAQRYAVAVTPEMAALIDPTNAEDPIARQFIPTLDELKVLEHESPDPIGDAAHSPAPGIVHRYPDRVLLKAVQICPVYCRFCFRREMVGPQHGGPLDPDSLEQAFAYIESDFRIWEVILTGGDPLVLSPRRLGELMARLRAIGHVKVVRFHTRVPVVMPAHVDDELAAAIRSCGKAVYVALHANHPKEFTPDSRAAIARLVDAGAVLVSQSVLLRGINDNVDTLAALMRSFVENRVKPYYLHHGDLAPGTSHFRLPIEEGQALVRALRGRLSGLCQPHYVLDIPGGAGKSPIGPQYLRYDGEGMIAGIEDWRGEVHPYPPPAEAHSSASTSTQKR